MNSKMSKFKNLIFYGIAVVLVLELSLYLLNIPKEYKSHSAPPQFQPTLDEELGYTNLKKTSIDFVYDGNPRGYFHEGNKVEHVTNSAGFRGPEISIAKPENTVRVLFLGDSITFGEGV